MSAAVHGIWPVAVEGEPLPDGRRYVVIVDLDLSKSGADYARLIAAAPELLAACQEVMRNFVAAKAEYDFKGEALGVTASRAAIAKAIGQPFQLGRTHRSKKHEV